MLASLFSRKLKVNRPGSHSRVTPSTDGPSTPTRSPGRPQRQLTRKFFPETEEGSATSHDLHVSQIARSKAVDELLTSMRVNTAGMRANLADAEEIYLHVKEHEQRLSLAMGDSESSANALHVFNEEMEGDFQLMKQRPLWGNAVNTFLDAALGKNPNVEVSTPALSTFLAETLGMAAPDVQPAATAVVGLHPENNQMLKVFHATDHSELKIGANMREIRENKESGAAPAVWNVLRTGQADLNNAHGIDRDKGKRSVVPLKSTSGVAFGCVVSGPPPVPDELLEMLCRQAGPLLERVWKVERAQLAVRNVIAFIKRYTLELNQLVNADFKKGARVDRHKGETWMWQPFVHNPNDPSKFELELKWKFGESIGVLTATCGTFTPMDDKLVVLLHVMSDVLECAIIAIEDLTPGDQSPLSTVTQVLDEYERARSDIPKYLAKQIHSQLLVFDSAKVFSEISHFEPKAVDKETFHVMQGYLCLLGHPRKNLDKWEAVRKCFKNPRNIHDKMLQLDVVAEPDEAMDRRWAEFDMSVKNLNLRAVGDRAPTSVTLIIRWLEAVHMTRNITNAIGEEAKPAPPNPVADMIFDEIDANKDDHLQANEITAYLLREFPTKVAHTVLRVLDTDLDNMVSREEWRRGWADGLLSDLLMREHDKEENRHEEGYRMSHRREAGVNALTLAAAAAAAAAHEAEKASSKKSKGDKSARGAKADKGRR